MASENPAAASTCLTCGQREVVAYGSGFKCRACGAEEPATDSGADGVFLATDPVPPLNGWTFDAEDIEELGLDLCIKAAERAKGQAPDAE